MDREQLIRERAYHFWSQEGRPDGRADAHWLAAAEQVALEEAQGNSSAVVSATVRPKRSKKAKPQFRKSSVMIGQAGHA